MIPSEYLVPYLISNVVALVLLTLAFQRPRWARIASVAIFLWACWTNARIGLYHPADYQTFGTLTFSSVYREFIYGWFREHTTAMLLPIAAGQLVIALLLMGPPPARRLGVIGAVVFLLAIAPLGVGSAFPFSLTYSAALLVMDRRLGRGPTTRGRGRSVR